jgi:uncharacterized YigZ family protein
MDSYLTLASEGYADHKAKGSKFLAFAKPMLTSEELKNFLKECRKDHPKASHYCFAYRLGIDFNNYRTSDDGEPSGTAGKPILNQIDSANLTNLIVIVIRYFGGTLLGIPGLTDASKTAASLVLQCTPVVKKFIEVNYFAEFDYSKINEVSNILKENHCTFHKIENSLFARIHTGIPKSKLEEVKILLPKYQRDTVTRGNKN